MVILPPDASDEAILAVVHRWVDALAAQDYGLPLNGVWSDLTAIFWLRSLPGGLALELYDIHIL